MKQHGQFEIMCALAAVGQLCDQELRELQHHLENCAECRQRIADFARVSVQALLPLGAPRGRYPIPKGMEARFTARALVEGVPFSGLKHPTGDTRSVRSLNFLGALTTGLLLTLVIVGAITRQVRSPQPLEVSDSTSRSAPRPDMFASKPIKPELRAQLRGRTTGTKPAIRLTIAKSAPGTSFFSISLNGSKVRDRQDGNGVIFSSPRIGSYGMASLTKLPVESAPELFLIASIQTSEQTDRLLPAAFEASSSKPVQHVFHYVPDADASPKQPFYPHRDFDWYRYWIQRGERPLRFPNNSAQ